MYGPSIRARRSCQNGERLKPSKPTEPSITATNANSPGVVSRPDRPENGIRKHEPALVLAERRDPREQAEVDGEAVPVRIPLPPPVGGHAEPHRVAVERDRERQRARARRLGVAELERREAEEEERAPARARAAPDTASGGFQSCPSFRQIHSTPFAIASHGLSTAPDVPEHHLHAARARARRSRR